jgi:hypothetical protein
MTQLDKRQTEALERIAAALEFFEGVHPDYRPTPGEPPLPSSPQARAYEDERLKKEAEAETLRRQVALEAAKQEAAHAEEARAEAEATLEKARAESDTASKAYGDAVANHAPNQVALKVAAEEYAKNAAEAERDLADKSMAEHAAKMKVDNAAHALSAVSPLAPASELEPHQAPVNVEPEPEWQGKKKKGWKSPEEESNG